MCSVYSNANVHDLLCCEPIPFNVERLSLISSDLWYLLTQISGVSGQVCSRILRIESNVVDWNVDFWCFKITLPRLKMTKQEINLVRRRVWCMPEVKEGANETCYSQSPRHCLERLSNQILSNAIGEITNRRNSISCASNDAHQSSTNPPCTPNITSIDKIITAK